jgi:hypothetical protein
MHLAPKAFAKYGSVLLLLAAAPSSIAQSSSQVPKNVNEAVLLLKSELSPKDREYLLRTPKQTAVSMLHIPFGTGVRNRFKLWGENPELMASCGVKHPEDCSGVIFEHLWEDVRSDSNPDLIRQLDCQFRLAEAIHIKYKGFDRLTTGQLLKSLQTQIDEQLASLSSTDRRTCQDSLTLEVAGHPNTECFVNADFAARREDKSKETTLDMFLGWIGFRNNIEVLHDPPKIRLDFKKTCAWPHRPSS